MASSSGGSLVSFVGRRLLVMIPLLFLISLIIYALVLLIPGGPAITLAGGARAKPGDIVRIRHELHLDQSFFAQYWIWLRGLLSGNLGHSLFQNGSVRSGIAGALPVTLSLATGAMILGVGIGLPLGIVSGIRARSITDRIVTTGSSLGIATPDFCLATILV